MTATDANPIRTWLATGENAAEAAAALTNPEPATAPADHRVTLAQIGRGVLLSCGARDFVRDDANGMLMFRVGPGRKVSKVIVTLMANDTYRVEYGYMNRTTLVWSTVEVETDIYADQLAATVRRLGDRERY